MPLIFALDALQGLHPRQHATGSVERDVTSAVNVVHTELGSLLDSDEGAAVKRLLAKVW